MPNPVLALLPAQGAGGIAETVLHELRTARQRGWRWRLGGAIGADQDAALAAGWLIACPSDRDHKLQLSPAGAAAILLLEAALLARSRRRSSPPSKGGSAASTRG